MAVEIARRGKRTLLISMDGKSPVCPQIANLSTAVYDTEESLREYVRIYVRVPLVSRLGLLAQTLDFVADAAPGVKEILAVGKVCYEVRADHYDVVVVDAESSGHIVGQLSTPRTIRSLVQFGLIREQTSWMVDMLADSSVTAAIAVATPEESPVDETIELVSALRETASVSVPLVIVNAMPKRAPMVADDPVPLVTATVNRRHDAAMGELRRLSSEAAGVEVVSLPRVHANDAVGVVAAMADALAEELGDSL